MDEVTSKFKLENIQKEMEFCLNKDNEVKQNCKSMRIKLMLLFQNSKKLYQLHQEEKKSKI
jgi:hypothetical protein